MKRFFFTFKRFLSDIFFLPLSYIGIRERREISPFFAHVIIGPLWESLIFQGVLLGVPVSFVQKSWNIPWLPDPSFDRLSKWAVIVFAIILSNFTFITFHRPGHFGTLFLELRAKRLLRKMEGAWVWKRHYEAVNYANELLPVAEELWVREGKDYNKFLQALSLYVLCHCDERSTSESYFRRQQTVERILDEVDVYPNDILHV